MNPHIDPGQPGLAQGPGKDDDGANYLLRLKGPVAEGGPADTTVQEAGKMAAAMTTLGLKERRQSPRLRCSGSVEFRTEGSEARLWGTLTDVSLHGCYVEMSVAFPVDTNVDLVLKSCGIRIQTTGRVRASYPALGMGICFKDVAPEAQLQLKQLLAVLTGHHSVTSRLPPQETREQEEFMKRTLEAADPRAALDGIQEFFQKNKLLSRDEFYQIAKRVRPA